MASDELKNIYNDMFHIEDAKPEDAETVRGLVRDRWVEIYPNEKLGITAEDIASIDWFEASGMEKRRKEIREMNLGKKHIWVMKDNSGKIVGFCKAVKDEEYNELDAIYTLDGYEGKGLGKRLLMQALEWMGNEKDIILKVVAYNTHAINFYKKFGFVETTEKVEYGGTNLPSGKEIPRIKMIKKIL